MDKFNDGDLFYNKKDNKFYKFITTNIGAGIFFLRMADDWEVDPLSGHRFVAECNLVFVGEDTLQHRLAIRLKYGV